MTPSHLKNEIKTKYPKKRFPCDKDSVKTIMVNELPYREQVFFYNFFNFIFIFYKRKLLQVLIRIDLIF